VPCCLGAEAASTTLPTAPGTCYGLADVGDAILTLSIMWAGDLSVPSFAPRLRFRLDRVGKVLTGRCTDKVSSVD
jgi:hypothetical protein